MKKGGAEAELLNYYLSTGDESILRITLYCSKQEIQFYVALRKLYIEGKIYRFWGIDYEKNLDYVTHYLKLASDKLQESSTTTSFEKFITYYDNTHLDSSMLMSILNQLMTCIGAETNSENRESFIKMYKTTQHSFLGIPMSRAPYNSLARSLPQKNSIEILQRRENYLYQNFISIINSTPNSSFLAITGKLHGVKDTIQFDNGSRYISLACMLNNIDSANCIVTTSTIYYEKYPSLCDGLNGFTSMNQGLFNIFNTSTLQEMNTLSVANSISIFQIPSNRAYYDYVIVNKLKRRYQRKLELLISPVPSQAFHSCQDKGFSTSSVADPSW